MAEKDDDHELLRRLKALKPDTAVFFDSQLGRSQPPLECEDHEAEDLIARFRRLGGRHDSEQIHGMDLVLESANDAEDNRTFNELIKNAAEDDEWMLHSSEGRQASMLLEEAKHALEDGDKPRKDIRNGSNTFDQPTEKDIQQYDLSEQQEAEEYMLKALAEAHTDTQSQCSIPSSRSRSQSRASNKMSIDSLDFPTAPTELPCAPSTTSCGACALIALPNAPTAQPKEYVPRPQISPFSDEQMETWCIICNDDATLRCLGCDGDLYCTNCWWEGHKSDDAECQFTKHEAVKYEIKRRSLGDC